MQAIDTVKLLLDMLKAKAKHSHSHCYHSSSDPRDGGAHRWPDLAIKDRAREHEMTVQQQRDQTVPMAFAVKSNITCARTNSKNTILEEMVA